MNIIATWEEICETGNVMTAIDMFNLDEHGAYNISLDEEFSLTVKQANSLGLLDLYDNDD